MHLEAADYPIATYLEENFETFRGEYENLDHSEFTPWHLDGAYSGAWDIFPLLIWNAALHDLDGHCRKNVRRCPLTMQLLKPVEGITMIGFSMLAPGTHVYPHVDAPEPKVYRYHLGIKIPESNLFKVDGKVATWSEGKCVAFNGDVLHEAANLSAEPRVVLIVDVRRELSKNAIPSA